MIQQEQANSDLSVKALCEALDMSPSGYYAWCERAVSKLMPGWGLRSSACMRMRLSAEGQLFTCLFASQGTDLREPLRSDGDQRAEFAAADRPLQPCRHARLKAAKFIRCADKDRVDRPLPPPRGVRRQDETILTQRRRGRSDTQRQGSTEAG